MTFGLADELSKQLSWHWEAQLRPRLDGLSDDEYLWEPVPGSWNLRPSSAGFTLDYAYPPPEPAPVTTIAWQLGHLLVGVLGDRNARHFGGPPVDYETFAYPPTAAAALADLDSGYRTWITGVRGLSDDDLAAPCGEPGFEQDPMIGLVLHIHREVIHHGAMISGLRDLWAHGRGSSAGALPG
ncbi:hypothetical protein GCM10011575_02730 [Microlunatus endophyticus]|uniref:DinB-like domain-containing protein n=1 Tax=Microlunatus endophyticus TaxID=1716077 RepID=A0A917S072_9ACTN|nr:DinB family protein [Microlunatus endophyticus]GGL48344.1 hypothetical protein GCM10011575_02730 [Microlunatus endophyticus]